MAKGAVKRGKKIGGRSLANKGAVGMAFRFHDSSIALVGCHMTSDKKGKSQVHRRNEDMRSLLESMEMGYEASAVTGVTDVTGATGATEM